jgi:glyoxalase family protein
MKSSITPGTERLNSMGIRNSGEIDRYYFRSLYFREPNGILSKSPPTAPVRRR